MSSNTSELGRELILQHVSRGADLLLLAACGTHMHNPYHNLDHELSVAYYAYSAHVNDAGSEHGPDRSNLHRNELLIAALFHDHNHSGGKTDDRDNIQRAIGFINGPAFRTISGVDTDSAVRIRDIIRCTQFFEGKFTYTPGNLCQRAIRDADLMMIYSMDGHRLLDGLFVEMATPLSPRDDLAGKRLLDRNETFLRGAVMHTQYGKWMKEFHLEDALRSFRHGHLYD